MKTYRQFHDYLVRRGFLYLYNSERDSYEIYDGSNFRKSAILFAEISARDARDNFDRAKDQIEMALALFGS